MPSSFRVCLAVDDEALSERYAALLVAAGYNPWRAYNAPSALLRMGQVLFDALVVDASCHRVDGASFLEFVKRMYPSTLIVAVVRADGDMWVEGDLSHADAVAVDPASAEDFQKALETAALRR